MGWHSLDSNPSLANSNVGALPQCPLLPTGVSGLHPLTQHPSVRDSSPGQGSESWHWTLTLVCKPPSHKASTHVPGLSLGSAGWASLGNGCAVDKSWASCPSIARRAKVTQAFLRSITTPGVPGPPQDSSEGSQEGAVGERGELDRRRWEGALLTHRHSWPTLPQAFPPPRGPLLVHLHTLQTLPRHSSKCLDLSVSTAPST